MRPFNELYSSVRSRLLSFCTLLTQATNEIETLRRTIESNVSALETDMSEALRINNERIDDVTAFYNIAKGHSHIQLEKPQAIPYDKKRLLQLNVQVNTKNNNDPFAAKLLIEAEGQLLYLKTNASKITEQFQNKRQDLANSFDQAHNQFLLMAKSIQKDCLNYVNSSDYQSFVNILYNEYSMFNSPNTEYFQIVSQEKRIGIGIARVLLPTPNGCGEYIEKASRGFYDSKDGTVALPVSIAVNAGSSLFVEYNNELESSVLSGIQNYLANIATYYGENYRQILFIDPIRYNNASLGVLSALAYENGTLFDSVPNSDAEISHKLNDLIKEITVFEKRTNVDTCNGLDKVIVIHNFPQGYDSSAIKMIQQICVNATRYNISIIMTHNTSEKTYGTLDVISYIKSHSMCINSNDKGFMVANPFGYENLPFLWYLMPNELPKYLKVKYLDQKTVIDNSNDYEKRIGLVVHNKPKGTRMLTDIPYGIDENGKILSLSFEQDNFSSFICGAAGSGKSTLLHTIITGLIENNHPDDIELWLIDYKMVEFSRYIEHRPPHVRYIILDQSPELVYDIIDRLTEIMIKRQNIFKGKWNELKDVPPDRYMPAIMVIIDEFPVMSQIIADSINYTENYMDKLDLLLSKGRGLGIHFIFASQNYTSGIRGLSSFAKMQTQQRIAMKTERNEIRETLSLTSPSDKEIEMMERLSVTKYFALARLIPSDDEAFMLDNRLISSKVINITDKNRHAQFLDSLSSIFSPMDNYDVSNKTSYIDKKTLVLDGNTYLAFENELPDMKKHYKQEFVDDDDALLFLGQPLRMKRFVPVTLSRAFGENILIISPQKENMPALSVLLSIKESLGMVMKDRSMEIWSSKKAPLLKQLNQLPQKFGLRVFAGTEDVCEQMQNIRDQIYKGQDIDRCICIMGFDAIVAEMNFQHIGGGVEYAKREEGQADLASQMKAGAPVAEDEENPETETSDGNTSDSDISYTNSYDICNDLKALLSNGPKYGCNIIMMFNSLAEYNQCKADYNLFRHRILFRIPRSDAMMIVGSQIGKLVEELTDHSFRYSDGINTLAYRPYLHEGISWDGWCIDDGKVINSINEESEYLQ